jgi:transcriptional regulator with AAA-type ATPase domain
MNQSNAPEMHVVGNRPNRGFPQGQPERPLEQEVVELRTRRTPPEAVPGLMGASAAMQELRKQLVRLVASDRPVLVTGPTGAGKELVVRSLHALGPYPAAPLSFAGRGGNVDPWRSL